MKKLLLLPLTFICTLIVTAQTPSDVLFNKYSNKTGVELSVNAQPTDVKNSSISTVIKAMTVNKPDDEKSTSKLYRNVKKDCLKFFKNKDYVVIQQEKDEHESFTVYKYAKNGTLEMCFLTISDETLTLELTQTKGLTEKAMANAELNVKRVNM